MLSSDELETPFRVLKSERSCQNCGKHSIMAELQAVLTACLLCMCSELLGVQKSDPIHREPAST